MTYYSICGKCGVLRQGAYQGNIDKITFRHKSMKKYSGHIVKTIHINTAFRFGSDIQPILDEEQNKLKQLMEIQA